MNPGTEEDTMIGTGNGRGRGASRTAALLALLAAGALCAPATGAETIVWNNPAGGNWNSAGNWDPQDVPNESGEAALFPAGQGSFAVDMYCSPALDRVDLNNTGATLTLQGYSLSLLTPDGLTNSGTILASGGLSGQLNQTATGRLAVPSGGWVDLYGAASNAGIITVGSLPAAGGARATICTPGYPLDGAGQLLLQADTDPNQARLESYYGTLVQGAQHTIRGSGAILVDLTNRGRVIADQTGRTLQLSSASKTNHGTFEATNGGTLQFYYIGVTQPDGTILADGGTVRVVGGGINGGTLDCANGGTIQCPESPSFTDVTNRGDLRVPGGSWPYFYGGATTNDGVIQVNPDGGGNDAGMVIATVDHLLQGTGAIVLRTAGDPNDARIHHYYGSLIQAASHTIRGAGTINVGLNNHGQIVADAAGGELRLAEQAKLNDGTIRAVGGAILRLAAPVTQSGAGAIRADGATIYAENGVAGGRLETTGGGTIECGGSPTLSDVTLDGQVNVTGGTTLWLYGAGTANEGRITVDSNLSGNDAMITIGSINHTLSGPGEILLQTPSGDPNDARLWHYYGSLIQNAPHTIRGDGRIEVGLTNQGTVNADAPGRTLLLSGVAKTNEALFEATGGGILRIETAVAQGVNGRTRGDGGDVELYGSLTGGRLETTGSSVCRVLGGSYLTDVRNLGRIDIPGGATPYLSGAGTTNDGTIRINSDGSANDAILCVINSTGHLLQGTGEIVMRTAGNMDDARLWHYYGTLVQGAAHTIRGAGRVAVDLTNYGRVEADVAGQALALTDNPKTNFGTMRARDDAALELYATFTNHGLVVVQDGGTLRTDRPPVNFAGGTLTGGAWEIHDNSTMRLLGADIQRLDGRVLLDGPNANLYRDDGTTPALAPLSAIEDHGHLELAGGRNLSTAAGLSVNAGCLTIGAGSTLSVNGAFTQSGNAETGLDVTCVNGVRAAASGPVVVDGGRLIGGGRVSNDVRCAGGIGPGAAIGELTVGGSYTQTETATCYIEIAGPDAAQFDRLRITGAAQLAGRLIVEGIGGYVPQIGRRFTILSFASRTGTFTLETGSPGTGFEYVTHYYADRVEIEITGAPSALPDGPSPAAPPAALAFTARPDAGGRAVLALDLPWAAPVEVSLFDFNGRRIALLRRGAEVAGRHAYAWDGIDAGGRPSPSGVYLARARIAGPDGTIERSVRTLLVR
jgi:hypothetical protein